MQFVPLTSAFRPPLAELLGRPWLPRLILVGSLILAAAASLGLKSGFEAHRTAHAAQTARMAAALWDLALTRLEGRLALAALDPRQESDTDRFQRDVAALRKEMPDILEEALLYAFPSEPPLKTLGTGLVVVSVAPGLPRGGPEQLGEGLSPAYAQVVDGRASGVALWADADPDGTPQLIVLALHPNGDGTLRAVQAYRFDAPP